MLTGNKNAIQYSWLSYMHLDYLMLTQMEWQYNLTSIRKTLSMETKVMQKILRAILSSLCHYTRSHGKPKNPSKTQKTKNSEQWSRTFIDCHYSINRIYETLEVAIKQLSILLFPTPCNALIGCHRAEKVIPMLNKWTVLPAIHIMKPIISRFLNGACATSQAFCLQYIEDLNIRLILDPTSNTNTG